MGINDKIRQALQLTLPELQDSSSPLEDDKENIYSQSDEDQPDDNPEIIGHRNKKRRRDDRDDGDDDDDALIP